MNVTGLTAVVSAQVFDGYQVLDGTTVVFGDGVICDLTTSVPDGAEVVDGKGCTLLPGLIDSHVHTGRDGLQAALTFGVTTELEMQGHWTDSQRRAVAAANDLADVRSAGFGITRRGGHPSHWFPDNRYPGMGDIDTTGDIFIPPFADTLEQATLIVRSLVRSGSDYIKIMVEDGHVLGAPGLPMLDPVVMKAAVDTAHDHGKLVVAHALTIDAALTAVAAGVDGLTHVFLDGPPTPQVIQAISESGTFVVPCLVLNASILGEDGASLANDPRVSARATSAALDLLRSSFNTYPEGNFEDSLAAVATLHAAGVDVLAGTDASPRVAGVAHGASVHHELQLLTQAGLTTLDALRAATSIPAARFGLLDRGSIRIGARADLLLVDGDPVLNVSDTLSIRRVWKQGVLAVEGERRR